MPRKNYRLQKVDGQTGIVITEGEQTGDKANDRLGKKTAGHDKEDYRNIDVALFEVYSNTRHPKNLIGIDKAKMTL